MLSILFWYGEDMEAAGAPQRINRKVNFAPLPGNLHLNFAPVVLELVSRLSFEANCSFLRTHFTFGLDVVTQHGTSARIAHGLNLREDNFAIPDILCQAHVDVIHKRFQLNHFVADLSGWRFRGCFLVIVYHKAGILPR